MNQRPVCRTHVGYERLRCRFCSLLQCALPAQAELVGQQDAPACGLAAARLVFGGKARMLLLPAGRPALTRRGSRAPRNRRKRGGKPSRLLLLHGAPQAAVCGAARLPHSGCGLSADLPAVHNAGDGCRTASLLFFFHLRCLQPLLRVFFGHCRPYDR